jgi:uncharacterized membrane protein SpoIIM required for sporulation
MAKKKESKSKEVGNPFVGIAGTIGGISVGIVAVFVIFAQGFVVYSVPIIIALAIMGMMLGFFASRKK